MEGRTENLATAGAVLGRVARWLEAEKPDLERVLDLLITPDSEPGGELATGATGPLLELNAAPATRAAVVTALMDLASQAEKVPLCRWLADRWREGGSTPAWVPVNATIAALPPAEARKAAADAIRQGFGCLKLKVGIQDDIDVARVRAVREVVGPDVALRLDANGAWDFRQARQVLARLEPFRIEYVEQPLAAHDLEGLARLRSLTTIPIAADESIRDLQSARRVMEAGAAGILVLKPTTLGGPDIALQIARAAAAAGGQSVITSALDGRTGRLAALHTAAALGPELPACGLATGSYFSRELTEGEEHVEEGRMRVPDTPGLGTRLATGSSHPASTAGRS